MPGHTPLVLQTTESPIEREALLHELAALIKREYDEVSLPGTPEEGEHCGSLHLGEFSVNFYVAITEVQQVQVWFDSVLYETLNAADAASGEAFDLALEEQFVRLCTRIAETADVAAFNLSLTFSAEPYPRVDQLQTLLLGNFEFTMTPPKLPLLAGIREELVASEKATELWGAEGIYQVGRYLIWDNLRPLSDEEETDNTSGTASQEPNPE